MKKLLAILLASAILCVFACVGASAADDRLAAIQAVLEEYNNTHGGTGTLEISTSIYANYYAVIGEVRGTTKGIVFPDGKYWIDWCATLTGTTFGEPLIKIPRIDVQSGEIEANGCAIECDLASVYGGSITAGEAIYAHSVEFGGISISGGTIRGNLRLDYMPKDGSVGGGMGFSGGSFTGAIESNNSVWFGGNAIVNIIALSAPYIAVSDNARITLDENGTVRTTLVEVHTPATISFKNRLQNCLYAESKAGGWGISCKWNSTIDYIDINNNSVCTVIGTVVLDDLVSQEGGSLIIPKGASLTLNEFSMWGDVVLDGDLKIRGKKQAGTYISIKGSNAWSLKWTLLKNTVYYPKYNWVQDIWYGPFMQFLLRCVFFFQVVLRFW